MGCCFEERKDNCLPLRTSLLIWNGVWIGIVVVSGISALSDVLISNWSVEEWLSSLLLFIIAITGYSVNLACTVNCDTDLVIFTKAVAVTFMILVSLGFIGLIVWISVDPPSAGNAFVVWALIFSALEIVEKYFYMDFTWAFGRRLEEDREIKQELEVVQEESLNEEI